MPWYLWLGIALAALGLLLGIIDGLSASSESDADPLTHIGKPDEPQFRPLRILAGALVVLGLAPWAIWKACYYFGSTGRHGY